MRDEELSRLLAAQRADAAERVATLGRDLDGLVESSVGANADDEHDPEGATIAFERAQLTALLAASRRRLADLDRALGRVADGTYGRCTSCGRPIAADRLAARPTAATCIDCVPARPR